MKKMLLINAGVLAASMIRNMMSMSLINNSNSEHFVKNNWDFYVFYLGCKMLSPFFIRSCFNIQLKF